MCLSFLGQIIFGALMVATLALTAVSLFTPAWREMRNETEAALDSLKHLKVPKNFGIFAFLCRVPTDNNQYDDKISQNSTEFCKQWFDNLPTWEKVVVAFMILALLAELITIGWTVISFFGCCCKAICVSLLPVLSLIVAAFLAIAVVVFAVNNQDIIHISRIVSVQDSVKTVQEGLQSEAGYSFYLACAAMVIAVIDFFAGWISLFLAKHCC